MLLFQVAFFFVAFFFPLVCVSTELPVFPQAIGDARKLTQAAEIMTWSADTMYEHVNGEAELLKRYGATNLAFTYYENTQGDYFAVELLDMGKPINAYGLYRLYAACEDGEYQVVGATVLEGDYTSYAILGRHFLRINTESDVVEDSRGLVDDFLSKFAEELSVDVGGKSMDVLEYLQGKARKPCEVEYHPEHLDFDLEAGPGYAWVGPNGKNYLLNLLPHKSAVQQHADFLRQKGVTVLIASGKTVLWQKEAELPLDEYPKMIVAEISALLR